ncbi:MAG: T9SS type A sorting domain-containing protein [Chitinophagaceae bacterium]|nr:T9SS type A sorting domain-containing protein [Chitinophagaceae bacterium]
MKQIFLIMVAISGFFGDLAYGQLPNCPCAGSRLKRPLFPGSKDSIEIIQSYDPNAIIGPDGVTPNHWVSVKDRLPYTILYENAASASAPAKRVRVISPIEPKEDAATFQLGSFGFNNQTFAVPPNTVSYYQRLDCRDSLGLYVDVTAGYDQIANEAFWEFQSIDPLTLLPPADPLKGFLMLQDSTQPLNGHGFVNFSIKPKQNAITLDTIGARADIVFDANDTIPTNIHVNTIDAFPPTSHMTALPPSNTNPITLSWTGTDDAGGCGIDYYTIYYSTDQVNFNVLIPKIRRNDTTLTLPPDTSYCFFVLATDRVGNAEVLRPGEIRCTSIGPPLPVTWLYFKGKTVSKDNLLEWATAYEQNSKQFDVERSLNGTVFNRITVVNAAGNSSQTKIYQYTDHDIDRLHSEYMFYRLKQIDLDGRFKYSNIVRLRYNENSMVNSIVYPNPTQGLITILVGDKALVGSEAALYDVNGRLLENIRITANSQSFSLQAYVNGVYYIRLSNKEVLKIVKQ